MLTCLLAYFGILFLDSRTAIDFQSSRFIIATRRSFSRRPIRLRVLMYESGEPDPKLPRIIFIGNGWQTLIFFF